MGKSKCQSVVDRISIKYPGVIIKVVSKPKEVAVR